MRKFYLLLIMLGLTQVVHSQVYTIGTGTGTNSNGTGSGSKLRYPCPYSDFKGKVRHQFLIKAGELLAAGAPAGGGSIKSVAFNMATLNFSTNTFPAFTISVGQTSLNSLTGFEPGLSVVYSQDYTVKQFFTPNQTGWNVHNFSSCFNWDGISNIIIETCYTPTTPAFIGATTYWTTGLGFNASVYDSTAACGQSAAPVTSTSRPNMQLKIIGGTDAYISSVTSPVQGSIISQGSTFSVSMVMGNSTCPADITSAEIGYSWNGAAPVTVNWTGTLPSNGTLPYTFTTTETAATAGPNVLKAWIKKPNGISPDGYPANDTLTTVVYVQPPASFDSLGYYGTEFWVAYMQNWDNDPTKTTLSLYFASGGDPATVSVYAPAIQAAPLFSGSVGANSVAFAAVPITIGTDTMATHIAAGDAINRTGLLIKSSAPISVYGLNRYPGSTDGFLAIPTPALGKRYVVMAQKGSSAPTKDDVNAPAEFVTIATQDATTITINALQATKNHIANTPWSVTLNKGQTYIVQAKATTTSTTDLTGSLITSNKPVAVFGGASCASMPGEGLAGECDYCNHLVEEIPPSVAWGKTYYSADFAIKTGDDLIRIVSDYTGTTHVSFNGTPYNLVNRAFVEIPLNNLSGAKITADQPIYVAQEAKGGACDNTSSDPMYINMIPEEQWGLYYLFNTPTNQFNNINATNFINVIKQDDASVVTVDGIAIPKSAYTQIGTSGHYSAQYPVAASTQHLVLGTSPLVAYVYGFFSDDGYGYPASGASVHNNIAVPINLLSFTGRKQSNNTNVLSWITANEINNDRFITERSVDGFDYVPLQTIKGNGTSDVKHSYSSLDEKPIDGINYYRLKQVDFNGKYTYSNIVAINNRVTDFTVAMKPSPVSDVLKISVNATNRGAMRIEVYDVLGNTSMSKAHDVNAGDNDIDIDVSELTNGVYFVKASQDGQSIQQKIIKY